jgi:hypothetical protein
MNFMLFFDNIHLCSYLVGARKLEFIPRLVFTLCSCSLCFFCTVHRTMMTREIHAWP